MPMVTGAWQSEDEVRLTEEEMIAARELGTEGETIESPAVA